jgi:hypothetical protein
MIKKLGEFDERFVGEISKLRYRLFLEQIGYGEIELRRRISYGFLS